MAAARNSVDVAELLITSGVDVHIKDEAIRNTRSTLIMTTIILDNNL